MDFLIISGSEIYQSMNGQLPFKNAFSFLPQIPIDLILFTEEKVQSRAVDKQKQTEQREEENKKIAEQKNTGISQYQQMHLYHEELHKKERSR
ncbi:MAG: hypothetical protein M3352_08780 [Bacteroidota bacterium]|nr:hypothetical protein [Bacteroidota bacterium]